jgi:hypothetical protein
MVGSLASLIDSEYEGSMYLRNVGEILPDDTALPYIRSYFSYIDLLMTAECSFPVLEPSGPGTRYISGACGPNTSSH